MPGTAPSQIAALASADDFEVQLLNLLIAHQDDAIRMARVETADGVNPAARDLAHRIELSRSAQIELMRDFLSG